MRSPRVAREGTLAEFVPILVGNLVPLVGVLALDWRPETLVTLYMLEFAFGLLLAGLKALFAAKPPREDREDATITVTDRNLVYKQGNVELPGPLPPVYPRNVPFVFALIGTGLWMGAFLGMPLLRAAPLVNPVADPTVLLGVIALIVGQSVDTWRDYFRDGRYEHVSPYVVVETPARQVLFLAFAFIAIPVAAVGGDGAVFGALVAAKLLFDWSAFRTQHGDGGQLSDWLSGPDAATGDSDPPHVPDSEPSTVVRTHRKAAVAHALGETLIRRTPLYVPMGVVGWIVAGGLLFDGEAQGWLLAGVLMVVLIALATVARVFESVITVDAMEYRRHGTYLVAYDTRLDAVQWSAPVTTIYGSELVTDRFADRYYGTRTFSVTMGSGDDGAERTLGPVAEPERLVGAFELPIVRTDFDPIDRRFVVAAVGGGPLVAAIMASLAVADPEWIILLLFAFPFPAYMLYGVWAQAYPDD